MKRANRVVIVVAIALICCANVAASDPKSVAEDYLTSLVRGDLGPGFAELMKHSDIDERNPDRIEAKAKQISDQISRYGKPSRFELISKKELGTSTIRLSYATVHPNIPIIWQFLFYRAESKWVLIQLRYNDDTKDLLD